MDETTGRYVFAGQRMGWRGGVAYWPLIGPEVVHVHKVGTLTALTVFNDDRDGTDVLADVPWTETDDEIEVAGYVAEAVRRRQTEAGEIVHSSLQEILDQIGEFIAGRPGPRT
ncbi:hypothetical protein ACTI_67710 [Actinoplanes sp. OR16]|uniref:hypothetical protein n=1 Tax=Actinoplanes sp. OR16 TaxID=946334 RepID=UPI000F6FFE00|nr:hypothetical protein [Actinoplanes sp. OR16]BBH70086.1 hypothetical protein ACTI_67710 [Actinoplanes sp. OR16]